ncbi:MAG: hypothetical protein CL676_08825 [Bdellovibrionaceae bacterium]|nr:hypothetical protein [Pseudobdellovibrionaceae bacterium]
MSNKNSEPQSLSEAIENLESKSKSTVASQLDDLQKVIQQLKPRVDEMFSKASHEIKDKAQTAEQEARKTIQEKPFIAVGLTALLFALIGFVLGRSSKD